MCKYVSWSVVVIGECVFFMFVDVWVKVVLLYVCVCVCVICLFVDLLGGV